MKRLLKAINKFFFWFTKKNGCSSDDIKLFLHKLGSEQRTERLQQSRTTEIVPTTAVHSRLNGIRTTVLLVFQGLVRFQMCMPWQGRHAK